MPYSNCRSTGSPLPLAVPKTAALVYERTVMPVPVAAVGAIGAAVVKLASAPGDSPASLIATSR